MHSFTRTSLLKTKKILVGMKPSYFKDEDLAAQQIDSSEESDSHTDGEDSVDMDTTPAAEAVSKVSIRR